MVLDLSDASTKFSIDRKKDEDVGVIMPYISREIPFHTSGINCPHEFWKKLKSMFDKVDGSRAMQIEKELTSLYPHCLKGLKTIWLLSRR